MSVLSSRRDTAAPAAMTQKKMAWKI